MHDYLGGHGSTFNCSIAWVALQCASKLVEIVINDCPTVQYSWIRSIYHDQVQISRLFGLNLLRVQCTYKRGSVVISIVPALVLFLPSNSTMLAHSEINNNRRKNSRKYSMYKERPCFAHNYIQASPLILVNNPFPPRTCMQNDCLDLHVASSICTVLDSIRVFQWQRYRGKYGKWVGIWLV